MALNDIDGCIQSVTHETVKGWTVLRPDEIARDVVIDVQVDGEPAGSCGVVDERLSHDDGVARFVVATFVFRLPDAFRRPGAIVTARNRSHDIPFASADAVVKPRARFAGCLEEVRVGVAAGWVVDTEVSSRPVLVSFFAKGVQVGFASTGVGPERSIAGHTGRLSFAAPLDIDWSRQRSIDLHAIVSNTDIELQNSPLHVLLGRSVDAPAANRS